MTRDYGQLREYLIERLEKTRQDREEGVHQNAVRDLKEFCEDRNLDQYSDKKYRELFDAVKTGLGFLFFIHNIVSVEKPANTSNQNQP